MHDNATPAVSHLSQSTAVNVHSLTISSDSPGRDSGGIDVLPRDIAMATTYGLICVIGLVGHGLVLFAVASDSKESGRRAAVTNVYIVSLSLADSTFLVGLPFVIVTGLAKRWIFGSALCKAYFMATCVSSFADAFTLTAMSADRCAAVCCPLVLRQCHCRTMSHARFVVVAIWTMAATAVLPVVIYSRLEPNSRGDSCTVNFPNDTIDATTIYSIYTLILGFVIPVLLISIFYAGLVAKLHSCRTTVVASGNRQLTRRRKTGPITKWRSRRITWLVTSVVVVYVGCWLPYWVFQVHLIMCQRQDCGSLPLPGWKVLMFQLFTVLSYANSAINPFLYAFSSSQFRQRFSSVFLNCRSSPTGSSAVTPRHESPVDERRAIGQRHDRRMATSSSRAICAMTTSDRRTNVQTGNEANAAAEVALSVVVELHEIPNGITIVQSVRTQTLTTDGYLL